MKMNLYLGILPSSSEIIYILILLTLVMGISKICRDHTLSASGKVMWIAVILVFNIFGYLAYLLWKKRPSEPNF